jgi:hypothetical protein
VTTKTVSTFKRIDVEGIGTIGLTVVEHGDGQPYLVLHGGAGPQSVATFAQLLADQGNNRVLTPTHLASGAQFGRTR